MEQSRRSLSFPSRTQVRAKATGNLPQTVPRWPGILPNSKVFPRGPCTNSFAATTARTPTSQDAAPVPEHRSRGCVLTDSRFVPLDRTREPTCAILLNEMTCHEL